MYRVTKRYGHEEGLSCVFRQPRANSHCQLLHGYALAFEFVFEARTLDQRNWVMDFGGLKDLKEALRHHFDHTMLIACDDPYINQLRELETWGLCNIRIVKAVGCEAFAEMAYGLAAQLLPFDSRVRLAKVTVCEHGANSATFEP